MKRRKKRLFPRGEAGISRPQMVRYPVTVIIDLRKNIAGDRVGIRLVKSLMEEVNKGVSFLSKRSHNTRIWSEAGMRDRYEPQLKQALGFTKRVLDMVFRKMSIEYRKFGTLMKRLQIEDKPLTFSKFSPIWVKQSDLRITEHANMRVPGLGLSPKALVVFGRYSRKKTKGLEAKKPSGWALLTYSTTAAKPLTMTMFIQAYEGLPFKDEDLGMDRGNVVPLYSPMGLIKKAKYDSAAALRVRESQLEAHLLTGVPMKQEPKVKVYGSIEDGMVDLMREKELREKVEAEEVG